MLLRVGNALHVGLMVLGALVAGAATAQAQQFSADIAVQRDTGSAPGGHLRVLDGKLRLETPELADGFFLVDTAKPSAYFVRPGARIYMDALQSSRLTRLLIPVDPDAPCHQWQAMAQLAGIADRGDWRCERTGEEMIDGRKTTVFRVAPGAGQAFVGWIDAERRFPLRIKDDDGTTTAIRNIKDEPQPAPFFDVPQGLQKFSPAALIERIKQSDVWVRDQEDKTGR
jgi:hypothetical protein